MLTLINTTSGQWTIKHLFGDQPNLLQNTMKFKNDSVGILMGEKHIPLAGELYNLLKTEDAGETWREIDLNIHVIIEDFQFIGDSSVYAVGEFPRFGSNRTGKFIVSHDLGETWDSIAEIPGQRILSIDFYDGDTGVISGNDRIYRTVDSGNTWTLVWEVKTFGYEYGEIKSVSLKYSVGFAIGNARDINNYETGFDHFLLKSTNYGLTWDTIKTFDFELSSLFFLNQDTGFISYQSSSKILLKTTDGGHTWAETNLQQSHSKVNSIHFPSRNIGYAVGEPLGYFPEGDFSFFISKTIDGGSTWETYDTIGLPLYSVHFTNDSIGYVSGSNRLIMKTEGKTDELPDDYPWHLAVSVENHETGKPQSKIYPNPTTGILNIEPADARQVRSIQIISYDGTLIQKIEGAARNPHNQINMSPLAAGMYIIQINYESKIETLKILKQ